MHRSYLSNKYEEEKIIQSDSGKIWEEQIFRPFLQLEREYMILSAVRYWYANFPTTNRSEFDSYWFEFGCHGGNTLAYAWQHSKHLFNFHYIAFDSFKGLPPIKKKDDSKVWKEGDYKTTLDEFHALVEEMGMPKERLNIVPGFYKESLDNACISQLQGRKAAVAYIDCDLYESTIPVLEFMRHFFQMGTILIFDDWNNLHGDPQRGERLAFHEFKERYPEYRFEELVNTTMQKSFIYIGNG